MQEKLHQETKELLSTNKYISRSEYYNLISKYINDPKLILKYENDLKPIVDKHNKEFIYKMLVEKK